MAASKTVPASWAREVLGDAASPPAVAPSAVPAARIAPRAVAPELVLVRRILSARAPDALAELEAGLLEAARGEAALAAWLTRPVESEDGEEHADPLDALRANLAQLTRSLKSLPKGKANASLYNSITTAVKAIEGIMRQRPREPTKDEIEERIAGAADEARAKIVEYTDDAYAKLGADRADLGAWAGHGNALDGRFAVGSEAGGLWATAQSAGAVGGDDGVSEHSGEVVAI